MGELFRECVERRVFAKVLSGLLVILDIFSAAVTGFKPGFRN